MSNDYKFIHLLLPLVVFINMNPSRNDLFYLMLFAILLIPKNYYWLPFDISISNFINPIVMLIMMSGIIIEGIYKRFAAKSIKEANAMVT